MLWRNLKIQQVYGANTDVGKTVVSTVLCTALQKRSKPGGLLYLKPVSTGPIEQADDRHLGRYIPGIKSQCISQFAKPVSPHIAARDAQRGDSGSALADDLSIIARTRKAINDHAMSGGEYALLETAGGTLSPSPSGFIQADLYRPLRLPVLLVSDYKLGGISSSISAFESLHLRGYDVDLVVVFDDEQWGNFSFLRDYLRKHDIKTFALPKPPRRLAAARDDELSMMEYYERTSTSIAVSEIMDLVDDKHHSRILKVTSMPLLADSILWHPFRQHSLAQEIIAIDSAYGDHFQAYRPLPHEDQITDDPELPQAQTSLSLSQNLQNSLTPLFDASASWWTQGFGHGNPDLSLTAAHAAGRYGHVMFANAVHAPALDISYRLLSVLKNPRLSRIFFTDNGSTGMEVAVKMALRASCAKYGWNKQETEVEVIGLQGSYHGDTIGVMNCSEPSTYNEKVDWHRPLGYWFNPPRLAMRKGVWNLDLPKDVASLTDTPTFDFDNVAEIFNFERRCEAGHTQTYRHFISNTLKNLMRDGRRFGALILEPVVMGAGGMIFVDPLFQRTLIEVVRSLSFSPSSTQVKKSLGVAPSAEWNGVPVIADEVFTGLYRLGRASSSSLLSTNHITTIETSIAPDISVHAKLLTGGLLPLAITTASESIFNTFLSDKKQDALLHGHSYTAHAIGCAVANKSLDEMDRLDRCGSWDAYKAAWTPKPASPVDATEIASQKSTLDIPSTDSITQLVYSFWSPAALTSLSHSQFVSGVWALGTVLSITLRSSNGASGYTSNAAAKLQNDLLSARDESGAGVHSRVLGDVLYLMTSLTTKAETVRGIEDILVKALC